MVVRIFPMVPCGFPMVPCGSPIVLCCFPMVLCHGATIRRSPAQLCGLPDGAPFAAASAHSRQRSSASSVPQSKRCGIHFRAAVSGAAAVSPAQRQVLPRSAVGKHHLPSCSCALARQHQHLPSNTCCTAREQPHLTPNTCVPCQAAASSST